MSDIGTVSDNEGDNILEICWRYSDFFHSTLTIFPRDKISSDNILLNQKSSC